MHRMLSKLLLAWLRPTPAACRPPGRAQVHPAKLCHALMAAAQERGAQLLLGTVCGISTAADGAVSGVAVRQHGEPEPLQLQTDAVVLAMGPWTGDARKWLASAPETSGQKYHSVVLRPRQPVSDTAVFTGFTTADGRCAWQHNAVRCELPCQRQLPCLWLPPVRAAAAAACTAVMTNQHTCVVCAHASAGPSSRSCIRAPTELCMYAASRRRCRCRQTAPRASPLTRSAARCCRCASVRGTGQLARCVCCCIWLSACMCGVHAHIPSAACLLPARTRCQGVAGSLASGLRDAQVEAQQACYLPLCGSGLPVIGRCGGGIARCMSRACAPCGCAWMDDMATRSCRGALACAGCRAPRAPSWRQGTAAGASSTGRRQGRRLPSLSRPAQPVQ